VYFQAALEAWIRAILPGGFRYVDGTEFRDRIGRSPM
jgi:hypothetical protein